MPGSKNLRSIVLLSLLYIPVQLFAQDTVLLKKQANALAKATVSQDYQSVIPYLYPKGIEMAGGKDAVIKTMTTGLNYLKEQGITKIDIVIGTPGDLYNAGTEIYCLVPEILTLTMSNGRFVGKGYLLAISSDKGKSWYFIDVSVISSDKIAQILPSFNNAIAIPAQVPPVFYPN